MDPAFAWGVLWGAVGTIAVQAVVLLACVWWAGRSSNQEYLDDWEGWGP